MVAAAAARADAAEGAHGTRQRRLRARKGKRGPGRGRAAAAAAASFLRSADQVTMNLDSIYRLLEETRVFPTPPPPSGRAPGGDAACSGVPCPSAPGEWDVCEELRRRELAETKARAAQMEKTMRWWADCTANWREKWAQVRAERNRAREDGRRLRLQLDLALKELSALRKRRPGTPGSQKEGLIIDPLSLKEEMKLNLDYLDLFKNDGSEDSAVKPGLGLQASSESSENDVLDISALRVPLDEFQKILWKEREMRSSMGKELECLESALSIWKQKYEELKESKLKTRKEVDILVGGHTDQAEEESGNEKQSKTKHQNLKDEITGEYRAKLERLRTSQWDKRETLETEKQELERENRSLRLQVQEMEALLYRTRRLSADAQGLTVKASQLDLQDQDQELLDLQHAYQKLSRQYQAKLTELTHANSRVDQCEAEVKKLRYQVEELKQGLNEKDNELDGFRHQIHKLQRALDEQKETNHNLETELRHLQNRPSGTSCCLMVKPSISM
ncbi:coiled-coil domain-containing protein 102B [Sorex fumeus]|uniref:coiled-coil domain-containing protein 102B n=1 Tax=Sorex fumeus TaxID=62283 RepID=UPI0024ACEA8A|nr:coiled-coil domain-containing protein 102B [Sorex fumeus]